MKVRFLLLSFIIAISTSIATINACPTSFCGIEGCEETDECCELEE